MNLLMDTIFKFEDLLKIEAFRNHCNVFITRALFHIRALFIIIIQSKEQICLNDRIFIQITKTEILHGIIRN